MVGGLIGAVLLLLRRSVAVAVFAAAWLCSVVVIGYNLTVPPPMAPNALTYAAILVISFLILAYFYWLKKRGVLR